LNEEMEIKTNNEKEISKNPLIVHGKATRTKFQNITITTLEKKHPMGVDHKQEGSQKEIQKHNSK
jgi:hypothetical protein